MDTPAVSLRKMIKRDPVPCEVFGNHWLHPIGIVDQFVLDATIREVVQGLTLRISDETTRNVGINQAITIGSISIALKESPEKGAKPVFSSFEEAYANLVSKPEETYKIFQQYADNFELTSEEKKTSQLAESSKTT